MPNFLTGIGLRLSSENCINLSAKALFPDKKKYSGASPELGMVSGNCTANARQYSSIGSFSTFDDVATCARAGCDEV